MNDRISEPRTERSGMDADVNMGITRTRMLFENGRLDEIIKKAKRKKVHEVPQGTSTVRTQEGEERPSRVTKK